MAFWLAVMSKKATISDIRFCSCRKRHRNSTSKLVRILQILRQIMQLVIIQTFNCRNHDQDLFNFKEELSPVGTFIFTISYWYGVYSAWLGKIKQRTSWLWKIACTDRSAFSSCYVLDHIFGGAFRRAWNTVGSICKCRSHPAYSYHAGCYVYHSDQLWFQFR